MLQDEGGLKAAAYHGGMTPKDRMQVQNDWRTGLTQVAPCRLLRTSHIEQLCRSLCTD